MSAAGKAAKLQRRAAKRPPLRSVHVNVPEGDYAGWEATMRADFSARELADLESGDITRIVAGLDRIITDHNFPDAAGDIAECLADVVPAIGLLTVAGALMTAIGNLPNR